jgi:DNA polymerase III epsilon subunit-like protein
MIRQTTKIVAKEAMTQTQRIVGQGAKLAHGYDKILEEYFQSNHFQFLAEKHDSSIAKLKQWMPLVYLRNRPLVCIDVEAWERNLKHVTEIGIAIFDPQALENTIIPVIKPYHIVVREHIKKYNGRFVADNKKNFLGGTSHVLDIAGSKRVLEAVLQKYLSDQQGVLVGHDVMSDIKWLNSIGIRIHPSTPIVDSFKLYNLTQTSGGSLRGILRALNIPHGYLHNGANDAYFTLLAVMGLCDPNIRKLKGLDTFCSEVKVLLAYDKRLRKFTDIAKFEHVQGDDVNDLIAEI